MWPLGQIYQFVIFNKEKDKEHITFQLKHIGLDLFSVRNIQEKKYIFTHILNLSAHLYLLHSPRVNLT